MQKLQQVFDQYMAKDEEAQYLMRALEEVTAELTELAKAVADTYYQQELYLAPEEFKKFYPDGLQAEFVMACEQDAFLFQVDADGVVVDKYHLVGGTNGSG